MTIYRAYPTEIEVNEALLIVNENLKQYAIAAGYVVIDGIIYGKTDGEVNSESCGTATWSSVEEIQEKWGFLDPATYRANGEYLMSGAPLGEIVYYVKIYPDD